MSIIKQIINRVGDTMPQILLKVLDTLQQAFAFLDKRQDLKNKKSLKKENDGISQAIDKACDKGSINDLLNLKNVVKGIILVVCLSVSGCETVIEVQVTKSWEGRYSSEKQLKLAADTVKLEKNEQAWLISNETLKRILKEQK